MQTTTPTRSELLKAVTEVRDAGGSTTHMLHTIARMVAEPAATPEEFELASANVFDLAGFHFDCLSAAYELNTGATPYPPDATFDALSGDDQQKVIKHVIVDCGELDQPDEEPPTPIALADHLLDGLRMARALQVEFGKHFAPVAGKAQAALYELLLTQSVGPKLAIESIGHALTTGVAINQAIAEMDGQL
ncbi:hypothetical protein SAMN05421874_128126 [Nonomuraea maritima]|uniref:Uncharacterized protein n=1 Tax=Nonomuraea maritima TaxID=683260 RepID=A0A1G9MPS3_9ACTN|nr:hypothetical protein [Nonomuraea maritima]SDL76093.1 hypothetical protein SAMN05421874_128126 [Nonomuraea maritima]